MIEVPTPLPSDFHTFSSRRVHSKDVYHGAATEQHLNVCHHLNHCSIQIIIFWDGWQIQLLLPIEASSELTRFMNGL